MIFTKARKKNKERTSEFYNQNEIINKNFYIDWIK